MTATALGTVMSLLAVLAELATSRGVKELALAIQLLELAELGPLVGRNLMATSGALA